MRPRKPRKPKKKQENQENQSYPSQLELKNKTQTYPINKAKKTKKIKRPNELAYPSQLFDLARASSF